MTDSMLLLRGPSQRPNDVAISLRAQSGCQITAQAMAKAAMRAKCPPAIAERVRVCILHSGRYDCRVSAGAAFLLARTPDMLGKFGGAIILIETEPDRPK